MLGNIFGNIGDDDWEDESSDDPANEIQITEDTVTFPTGTYKLADITGAKLLASETKFFGMDRKTALPAIAAASVLVLGLAQLVPAFLVGGILLAARLVFSMLGIAALRWTKDKKEMFSYTVALETANGTINAYTSTNKETVRRMVSAVNRAVRGRNPHEAGDREHKEVEKQPQTPTGSHTTKHPQRALRPEALPKLRDRH